MQTSKYKPSLILVNKQTLDVKQISFKNKFTFIVTFIFLSFLFFYGIYNYGYYDGRENQKTIIRETFLNKYLLVDNHNKFTEDKLIALLTKLKVKHIDIVIAQAKIETGNYKSQVFLENNNLFGMRLPGNRITTAIESNLGHAKYDNWEASVIDYAIYQSTYLKNYNRNEYLMYLKLNYAKNQDYVVLINKISKQIQNKIKNQIQKTNG